MTELERLRKQRNEINRQIAQLTQTPYLRVGRAKLDQDKGDCKDWYVSVMSKGYSTAPYKHNLQNRYFRLITVKDKSEIMEILPEIIRDLQALHEVMMQEKVSEMNAKEGEHDD